ncbi:TPA: hypothetical protein N0W94_005272 [Klebsiella pneumoniae]|nr:hypothetical protein [Klebsiella pneumoniae]HCK7008864.1 hypothetical protein [Klebsiella pneumoniae]HDT4525640.1 hypothetical protein [Klebsiella pneumoniae subsp. pneumoniae]
MARNDKIGVTFTGDASPLKKAASDASQALDQFGDKAGGSIGNAASKVSGGLKTISGGLSSVGGLAGIAGGAVAIAGLAATAAFNQANDAAGRALDTFRSATLGQMGFAQVQQMGNMFRQVGLTIENVADQQKDLKDKLQDGLFNQAGSMYTDVIQPLKLNILELQKAAAAGEDVYSKIYFAAKAQGYSNEEMTNMFETIGNDAVLRLGVYKQYNSEQEYSIALGGQNVQMTEQQAQKFLEYDNASNQLRQTWETWKNETVSGLIPSLIQVVNLMAQILNLSAATSNINLEMSLNNNKVAAYEETNRKAREKGDLTFVKMNEDHIKILKEKNAELQKQADWEKKSRDGYNQNKDKFKPESTGYSANQLKAAGNAFLPEAAKTKTQLQSLETAFKQYEANARASLDSAYKGDTAAMERDIALHKEGYEEKRKALVDAANKGNEQAAKAAEAAARKEKALADKKAREKEQREKKTADARQAWNKIESDLISNSYLQQLAEFDRQQQATIDSIKKHAATLGISPQELLQKQKDFANSERTAKINSMVGITDTNKDFREKFGLANSGQLNDTQKGALGGQVQEQAMQGFGYDGWKSDSTLEREKTQIDERQRLQEEAATALITNAQDRENALNAIQAKADSDRLALTQNNVRSTLTLYEGLTGELGTALSNAFGEGSAAAKAAFAVQSGLAIAQTVMNIQVALSNALALPFPLNIPEYLKVGVMGASIISRVKNAASGQAHGGIDEVPGGAGSESTWILKGGERVLQPQANKDLSKFLEENEKNGGSTSGDITINSPMIVQGSISDEKQFTQMLNKHQNQILQNVRQAQKRNS